MVAQVGLGIDRRPRFARGREDVFAVQVRAEKDPPRGGCPVLAALRSTRAELGTMPKSGSDCVAAASAAGRMPAAARPKPTTLYRMVNPKLSFTTRMVRRAIENRLWREHPVVAHQRYVGGLNGHVRASCSHRNSDVSWRHCRGIVDAVPDHDDSPP